MNIYKGKKVFITGVTGFKGSWLALMLLKLGADVKGYALDPETDPNNFNLLNLCDHIDTDIKDIKDYYALNKSIREFKPDIIFHLSAQALVRKSYRDPYGTFYTNVLGTINLLNICKNSNLTKAIVNVTTDKCYQDKQQNIPYKEGNPLGGDDPYSASKACSEIITHSYRKSFFDDKGDILVATARAGNVIGGGDFSEDRLLPDIMKAMRDNSIVILRNPDQVRPFQHVLDPLRGYLMLGERLLNRERRFADAWNFAPDRDSCISVQKVIDKIKKHCYIRYDIQKKDNLKETEILRLDNTKAKKMLKWYPFFGIEGSIKHTVDWYKEFFESGKESILTEKMIEYYLSFTNII